MYVRYSMNISLDYGKFPGESHQESPLPVKHATMDVTLVI